MNTTIASGSFALIARPVITIGDGVSETLSASIGNSFRTYSTNAGQQELVKKPRSRSSSASVSAVSSAPAATSTTSSKPIALIAPNTFAVVRPGYCEATAGATMA